MSEKEEWRPVVGFEESYEVSNTGVVRSIDRVVKGRWPCGIRKRGAVLKQQKSHSGYFTVVLYKDDQFFTKQVHRLVAEAFIPNPLCLPQVNHKDINKTNNHANNLEWMSGIDNIRHAFANGCFVRTQRQIEHARSVQREIANKKRKCVAMMDPNTEEIIGIFRSITDAERITGISSSKISAVCNGKRQQTGGYKWKHMEDQK